MYPSGLGMTTWCGGSSPITVAPAVTSCCTSAHTVSQPFNGRSLPQVHKRHTFAVTRLLQWYRDGEDVMARLPLLSTYLGHASIADTELYLSVTTALLEEASSRFHTYAQDVLASLGAEP